MKKVLLTAIALLSIVSSSVFGMYGINPGDWMPFLLNGNEFRARFNQIGFKLGNDSVKGAFGVAAPNIIGNIFSYDESSPSWAKSVVTLGAIAYTSPAFGIGVGYGYRYIDKNHSQHVPLITMHALNNSIRFVMPVSINAGTENNTDHLGLRFDPEIRWISGIDAFNQLRLRFKYGNVSDKVDGTQVASMQNIGVDLKLYFLNTTVGNASFNPILRVIYHTTIGAKGKYGTAMNNLDSQIANGNLVSGLRDSSYIDANGNLVTANEAEASKLEIKPGFAISIWTDLISLYGEPSIGYSYTVDAKTGKAKHDLTWGAYAELYIKPAADLEWYFEMNLQNKDWNVEGTTPFYSEVTTGLTWYIPPFN